MTEQSALDRAMTLAEMAPHSSVTIGVLSGQEGRFSESRLAGRPPVTYLERTEAPAYVLTNQKRGIGLGTKRNRTTPDDDRGTVVLITGLRTLCLVGREPDDETFSIPHRSLAGVSYATGRLAHRLTLDTPRKRYHCWIDRRTDEAVLDQVTTYIEDRLPETPAESTDDEQASTVTYRGKPIQRPKTADPVADGGETDDSESTITYRGKEVDPSYLE